MSMKGKIAVSSARFSSEESVSAEFSLKDTPLEDSLELVGETQLLFQEGRNKDPAFTVVVVVCWSKEVPAPIDFSLELFCGRVASNESVLSPTDLWSRSEIGGDPALSSLDGIRWLKV